MGEATDAVEAEGMVGMVVAGEVVMAETVEEVVVVMGAAEGMAVAEAAEDTKKD